MSLCRTGHLRRPHTDGMAFQFELLVAVPLSAAEQSCFDRVRRPKQQPPKPRPQALVCPNCDTVFEPLTVERLYCSLRCHDEAKTVRYARKKYLESPGGLPSDIHEAIDMKRGHALAGGYDETARRLSPETRQTVKDRDRGLCVLCGCAGDEIDHIDGPSSDLSNLRLLCHDCHMDISKARFRPITDDETWARRQALMLRIHAAEPLQPCDGPEWSTSWRAWRQEHAVFP